MKEGIREFRPGTFRLHIGQVFRFEGLEGGENPSGETFELELVEVNTYGKSVMGGEPVDENRRESFSLLFILRGTTPLGRGLHRLAHEHFEPCELFLSRVVVPQRAVKDRPATVYYEAVFG